MDLLGRLFAIARNRDGQARALEAAASEAPAKAVAERSGAGIEETLAAKLLEGWLSNRSQTLVPHTLNFRALSPDEAELLIDIMVAAAQADGAVDPREARQLPLALARVGAGEAEARHLEAALAEPQNPGVLLSRAQEAGLATHAYAAALLAINRRGRANRAFLDYMAARLGVAPGIAGSLERRYRM